METTSQVIPKPRNPYGPPMSLLGLGLGVGVILILESGIGEVGRPKIAMLMPGIMLATMAFIFLFGVIYAWRGFEKRFGTDSLVGYWEIEGEEWREHLLKEKAKLIKLALIGGLVLPGIVLGVVLLLAHSDGDLEGVLPVALMTGGGIAMLA